MKLLTKRRLGLVFLLVSFVGLLLVAFGTFAATPYTKHFTEADLAGLVFLIFYACFMLFVQLPVIRRKYVRLYRLGILLISPCLIALLARLDWTLSRMDPHSFSEVLTKWDSVYFTITTLATVGYGDIHPVSQGARIWTTAQIVIGFVFIAIVIQKEVMSGRNRRKSR